MYAFGLTIDSRMNAASCTLFFVASSAGVVSRSGPIVALEPAGRKVWQAPQPPEAKTDLPWAGLPAAVVAVVVAAVVAAVVVAARVVVAAVAAVVVPVAVAGVVAGAGAATVTVRVAVFFSPAV